MTDTANHRVPEQGKLRRALAVVFAWLQAMEYTGFDYTLDRIECLEREVGQLKRNCAKAAIWGSSMLTTIAPLGSNIDGTGESPSTKIGKRPAHKAHYDKTRSRPARAC
jgi:hypothetical protein